MLLSPLICFIPLSCKYVFSGSVCGNDVSGKVSARFLLSPAVFEGSEVLRKLCEGLTPEQRPPF